MQLNLRHIFLSIVLFIALQPQVALPMSSNVLSASNQEVLRLLNKADSEFNIAFNNLVNYKANHCSKLLKEYVEETSLKIQKLKEELKTCSDNNYFKKKFKQLARYAHSDKMNHIKYPLQKLKNLETKQAPMSEVIKKEEDELNELFKKITQSYTTLKEKVDVSDGQKNKSEQKSSTNSTWGEQERQRQEQERTKREKEKLQRQEQERMKREKEKLQRQEQEERMKREEELRRQEQGRIKREKEELQKFNHIGNFLEKKPPELDILYKTKLKQYKTNRKPIDDAKIFSELTSECIEISNKENPWKLAKLIKIQKFVKKRIASKKEEEIRKAKAAEKIQKVARVYIAAKQQEQKEARIRQEQEEARIRQEQEEVIINNKSFTTRIKESSIAEKPENPIIKINAHQITKEAVITNVLNNVDCTTHVSAQSGSSDNVSNKFSLWLKGLGGQDSFIDNTNDYKSNIFGFVGGLDYNFTSDFLVGLFSSKAVVAIKNLNPSKANDYIISEAIGGYTKYRMKQLSLSALGMRLATEQENKKSDSPAISYILDIRAKYDILLTQNLFLTPIVGFQFCRNNEFSYKDKLNVSKITANNNFKALFGASISKQLLFNNYIITSEIHAIYSYALIADKDAIAINTLGIETTNQSYDTKGTYLNIGAYVKNQTNYTEITFGGDAGAQKCGYSLVGYLQIKVNI